MSWIATVATGAAVEPVLSIDVLREHCRVLSTDEDAVIAVYAKAAQARVEQECSLRLADQSVLMRCETFDDLYSFPVRPISAVTAVKYLDSNGAEQILSTDIYEAVVAGLSSFIRLKPGNSWPTTATARDAVRVEAQAGYATLDDDLTSAMLLIAGNFYANREAVIDGSSMTELPMGVDALLAPYRV